MVWYGSQKDGHAKQRRDPRPDATDDAGFRGVPDRTGAASGDRHSRTAARHAAFRAGADAELAWRAVVDVKCHMDRVCHLTLWNSEVMLQLIAQHDAIVGAIDAGDADRADAAMRQHLSEILRSLPRVLADRAD